MAMVGTPAAVDGGWIGGVVPGPGLKPGAGCGVIVGAVRDGARPAGGWPGGGETPGLGVSSADDIRQARDRANTVFWLTTSTVWQRLPAWVTRKVTSSFVVCPGAKSPRSYSMTFFSFEAGCSN